LKREEKIKGREITDIKAKLINIECKPPNTENPLFVIKNNDIVIKLEAFSEGKISLLLNNFVYIEKKISDSMFDKIYTEEITNYVKLNDIGAKNNSNIDDSINSMSEFYSEKSCNNKCIKFFNRGKSIVMGGFYDGKLMVYTIENKKNNYELYPFIEEKPILSVEIDREEKYLFLGNSIGNLCIYQMEQEPKNWKIIKFKNDQITPISHIYCNNDLNLWSSTTIDGYINIYTLPVCKLIRCIKASTKNCSYAFLSSSPLPSVIVINDEENNSEFFVYSINGKFMFKQQEYIHLTNPILIKDINSFEYLAYVGNNSIIIRKLPNLDIQVNFDCSLGIYSICVSEDNKSIFTVDKNGKKISLVKDEK